MDTMQKNPSSMIHHPAVKLVVSLTVLIIVVILSVWLYKKYAPSQMQTTRELTPAQKEEIIQQLDQQAASMPKIDSKQQQEIINQLNVQSKQQATQPTLTEDQKKEIIDQLNRQGQN